MKKAMYLIVAIATANLFANGWECVEKGKGEHSVVLYNYVKKEATKTPAAFKLSDGGEVEELAWGDDISMETVKAKEFQKNGEAIKTNKKYTVNTEGFVHNKTEVASVLFYVNANQDAENLVAGQLRSGRLYFVSNKTGKLLPTVLDLSCQYYLKGERQKLSTQDQIRTCQKKHEQLIKQGKIDQAQQQD